MRTSANVELLLAKLGCCVANDLENQDFDFKQWDLKGWDNTIKTVVQMAVRVANGGSTVVFGIADWIQGADQAILGVSSEIDSNLL